MLGGWSIDPNENISNEHGAVRKCAGGMDPSVWPGITPPPLEKYHQRWVVPDGLQDKL